jgi:hypothetical protein
MLLNGNNSFEKLPTLPTLLLPTRDALLSNTNDTNVKYKDAIEAMNEELNNIIERNNDNNKESDSLQATLVPLIVKTADGETNLQEQVNIDKKNMDRVEIFAKVLKLKELGHSIREITNIINEQGYSISTTVVHKITSGKANIASSAQGGRPKWLPDALENNLARVIINGTGNGGLKFQDVRKIAETGYANHQTSGLAKVNSNNNQPKFSRDWFSKFKARHSEAKFGSKKRRAVDMARLRDTNPQNLYNALMGVKTAIVSLPKDESVPKYFLPGNRLLFLDEASIGGERTEVSRSRSITAGSSVMVPKEINTNNHITLATIFTAAFEVLHAQIIRSGTPVIPPHAYNIMPHQDPIIYTPHGSIEGTDDDGKKGSWQMIMELMVDKLAVKYGAKQKIQDSILIYDNHKVHLDLLTLEYLRENKITVVCWHPNTSSAAQPHDTHHLHGSFQEMRRKLLEQMAVTRTNFNLEENPQLITSLAYAAFSPNNIMNALKDTGFIFHADDSHLVGVTDESAVDALNRMAAKGTFDHHIQSNPELYNNLRSDAVVTANTLISTGKLPISAREMVTSNTVSCMTKIGTDIANLRKIRLADNRRKSKSRKSTPGHELLQVSDVRAGTYIVNSTEQLEIRKKLHEEKKAEKIRTQIAKEATEVKKKIKLDVEQAKLDRIAIVEDLLPKIDVERKKALKCIMRYATGKNPNTYNVEWARKKLLEKKWAKSNSLALPPTTSAIGPKSNDDEEILDIVENLQTAMV